MNTDRKVRIILIIFLVSCALLCFYIYWANYRQITITLTVKGNNFTTDEKVSCKLRKNEEGCMVKLPELNSDKFMAISDVPNTNVPLYDLGQEIEIKGDTTLYFIEEETFTYTLTIDGNGSELQTVNPSCKTTKRIGSCEVDVPDYTRNGFEKLGYSKNKGNQTGEIQVNSKMSLTGDETIYAISRKKVTATYQGNAYMEKTSDSCYIYNTNTSCNITLTKANVPNVKETTLTANGKSYIPNTTVPLTENLIFTAQGTGTIWNFSNQITYSDFRYFNNLFVAFDSLVENKDDYIDLYNKVNSKTPYLFQNVKEHLILNENNYNTWKDNSANLDVSQTAGITKPYETRVILKYYNRKTSESTKNFMKVTVLHENTHAVIGYYNKNHGGERFYNDFKITNLYNKYRTLYSKTSLRPYAWENGPSEFCAELYAIYYATQILPLENVICNSGCTYKPLNNELLKAGAYLDCIFKNNYNTSTCQYPGL